MLTGIIVFIAVLLFCVFLVIYKRDILIRLFTLDMHTPANELKQQLENTADTIIKQLENQISYLEYLLAEADQKAAALAAQLQAAERLLEQKEYTVRMLSATAANPADDSIAQQDSKHKERSDHAGSAGKDHQDKRQLILAMASQGYNATEIAKATGIGKGEIMLILQLNKR